MIDGKKLIRAMWDKFNAFYNVALRFDEAETKMANRVLSDIQKMIEEQEEADKWISVNKSTPEDFERVLAWIKWKNGVEEGYIYGFTYCVEGLWYGDAFGASREVVAWMPLPPRYEGEIA